MEDYYAILEVDPWASQEAIKLSYRRLARESHPDRYINSTEAEKGTLSLQMSRLNGAYAVLSDTALRREYDQKLQILNQLGGNSVSADMKTPAEYSRATKPTKPNGTYRVANSNDSDLTLVQEFSKQLRSLLLANRRGFSWKEIALDGFEWGLESVSWTMHFCVGGRSFVTLDAAAARKFATYSESVITRHNRVVRTSHFLFLLPFQHLSQWEIVSAEFNRFFSSQSRANTANVPVGIVLFDARMGSRKHVGGPLKDKHFEDLLSCLKPDLMASR